MWCNLRIDLYPHYSGEYFFTNSTSFLTIFLLVNFVENDIQIDENLDLGVLKR